MKCVTFFPEGIFLRDFRTNFVSICQSADCRGLSVMTTPAGAARGSKFHFFEGLVCDW